jgi:AcrR family transcriptional regulator
MPDFDTNSPAPQDRPLQPYHHGELRPALIRAARQILEETGLDGLALREVARRAGVSRQAPYHHFADKRAMLAAVAAEGFRELAETSLQRMDRATDTQGRLNASGVAYVVFAANNPALFQLMFGGLGGNFANDAELQAARRASFQVLEDAVAGVSGQSHRADPLSALRSWSLVHGLAELVIKGVISPTDYGVMDAEALIEALISPAAH